MKTVIATLALVGSVLAGGAADGVNQVLTQIAGDLKDFDAAIKAFDGKSTDNLLAAAKKIEQTTSSGAQAIASGPDLSLTDAVGITSNVQSLQATLDGTLSDLKGIAQKLTSGGQCSTILGELDAQAKSAQALQDAITNKAPNETKAVASQLGGAIGKSIENTSATFKEQCGAAGGAPSGGSAPSTGSAPSGGAAPAGGDAPSTPTAPKGTKKGDKTKGSTQTSAPAKPAQYTGAGSTLTVPFFGAIALALFVL